MAFWTVLLFVASTAYQVNQQKKAKKKAEARRQQMLGFELSVEKRPIHLPRVYGMGAVSGVRSQHSVSDSITITDIPVGSDFVDMRMPSNQWTVGEHTGSKKEYLHVQQAVAIGSISQIIDITVDENDWDSSDARFSHMIRSSLGGGYADPTAESTGIKNWDTNLFGGCSWLSMTFWLNRDDPQYNGVPEVRVWYKGTAVNSIDYDSGSGAYSLSASKSYSHNPALCLLDYLTAPTSEGGCGYSAEDVDLESFYRVSQLSDTKVVLGATVRGRLNGVRPVKDGEPSGATTRDLSLYECHLAIDTEAPRRDNINRFLQCMNGANLVWSEGQYKLIAEYPTTQAQMDALVSAQYTDEDVILGSTIEVTHPNAEDRLQRATVRFKNESTDLVEDSVAWPKRNSAVHTQFLAEDNGIVSETEVEFEGCINRKLALAKAEYLVRQSRNNKTVSLEIKTDGWVHEQGDFIKITSTAANITGEIYQIEKIRVTAQNTVQITARRFDWQDLSWNVDDNYVEPTSTFFSSQIPNPTNLVWNSGSRNGDKANGWLSWTKPNRGRRFHIAHRLTNETEWTHLGETGKSHFDIPAELNDGQDRYFIVRTETPGGRLSDGAIVLADVMPNLVPVTNIQKTKTGAGVRLTWDNSNPELVSAYKVWTNTVDVRGSASLYDTVTGTAIELNDLPVQAHYAWIDTHGYSGAVAAQSSSTLISAIDLHVQGSKLDANTIAWSSLALDVRDQIDSAGDANQSAANALASELAANTFAAAASSDAAAANSSALAANTSAANALSSEQAAAVSETNAAGSSASAATSATNAATSETNAGNSASAASTSASAASTSATNAAQSATSATSSENAAATSAGEALTYKNAAAISATTASDAAAAAVVTEGVVAQMLGSESFSNPTLRAWDSTYPDGFGDENVSEGSISKVSGKYGNALRLDSIGTPTANRPYIQIRNTYPEASFSSADDCVGLRIEAEISKVNGYWNSGACFRINWAAQGSGGTSANQYVFLNDHRDGKASGDMVLISETVTRPESYVPGDQPGILKVFAYACSDFDGARNGCEWDLHRLSIREVTSASSTYIQQQAITDLNGNAAASLVFRAKAGGATGAVEIVAANDVEGGSASQVNLTGDEIRFDGLSVFGDDLRSSDYSANTAGWVIKSNGDAEFNNLVVREWLVDGAASNGGTYTSYLTADHKGSSTGLGNFNLGEFAMTEFWNLAFRCEYRDSSISYGTYNQKELQTPVWIFGTQVSFQYRTKTSGSWSSWTTLYTSPMSSSGTTWHQAQGVYSLQGVYDDVQMRTYATISQRYFANQPGNLSGNPDVNYNNVKNNAYVARALVR